MINIPFNLKQQIKVNKNLIEYYSTLKQLYFEDAMVDAFCDSPKDMNEYKKAKDTKEYVIVKWSTTMGLKWIWSND